MVADMVAFVASQFTTSTWDVREKWNIFIASDSPAAKVPGARASRYRVYGVIGLHIGNYPNYPDVGAQELCSVVLITQIYILIMKFPQNSIRAACCYCYLAPRSSRIHTPTST